MANDKAELVDHVVTKEDMKVNPEFKDMGIKVGDTVQIPKNDSTTADAKDAAKAKADEANKVEVEEEETEEVAKPKAAPVGKDGKPLPAWMVA